MTKQTRSALFSGKLSSTPFAESYDLTSQVIGRGGHGTVVWRARELGKNRHVAIKVVRLPLTISIGLVPSAKEEFCSASLLNHNLIKATGLAELEIMAAIGGRRQEIVELHEAFIERGNLYLVMDLMASDLCAELMAKSSAFPEQDVRKAMYKVIDGLRHCHANGIAHRDVKLENIFLRRAGDLSSACLGDFGLGHMKSWGICQGASGSHRYMAPEVISQSVLHCKDDKGYDGPAADMWSVGIVMYALLWNRFPFDANSRAEMKAELCANSFKFETPVLDGISFEAIGLLKKLLTVDHVSRCTAVEALSHKWFEDVVKSDTLSVTGSQRKLSSLLRCLLPTFGNDERKRRRA